MKINIKKRPKHLVEEDKRKARRQWHEAFAWIPQKVDKTDEGHSVVWFEKYMRKEIQGPTNAKSKDDGRYWEQYSSKTYFKKKLNGDFEKKSGMTFTDISAGSTLYYNTTGSTWLNTGGATTVFDDSDTGWYSAAFGEDDTTVQFEFDYDTSPIKADSK